MSSGNTLIVQYISVAIAVVFVTLAWLAVAGISVWLIRLRRNALSRGFDGDPVAEPGSIRWLIYAVSAMFWPAGIGFGLWFIRRPETIRTGEVCLWILLAYVTFSVFVADAIVIGIAVLRPDWLMMLSI